MSPTPPSSSTPGQLWPTSLDAADTLVSAALAAHKAGTLAELLRQRPGVARWVTRRWLRPVLATAGDRLPPATAQAAALALLLRWAAQQLRPDQAPAGTPIERAAWLHQTSWRPMLAVWCHYGFEPVPDFRDHYRRRADESAADNLGGLWAVGPSTFYRYLDKGKRALAERLTAQPPTGERRVSLRQLVNEALRRHPEAADTASSADWHHRQAAVALAQQDPASALWHLLQTGDVGAVTRLVNRSRSPLARDPEAAFLIDQCLRSGLGPAQQVDLLLARAALWRTCNDEEQERLAYEQALQRASAPADKFLIGVVYGALGRFHEVRDTDRALAYFEDGADLLRVASEQADPGTRPAVLAEYLSTLVRLAWQFVLRNDPRSRAVLDKADALRDTPALHDELVALLEQTWGEYWRRAGDLRRALEHKHRALNIYERLGDRQQILSTYNNLSDLYGETKDYTRALEYGQRVLTLADKVPVDPYVVASVHLNMGATRFWMEDCDAAIAHYQSALALARDAHQHVIVNRARYSLAEAHFKRFQITADPVDEQTGDAHVAAGIAAAPAETEAHLREGMRTVKEEILGTQPSPALERLIPEEHAAHPEEMAEVQRQRTVLAVPMPPEVQVRAHIAIARAYLAISTKEREAALALIQKHQLSDDFDADFAALHSTFQRELTREQRLAAVWQDQAADLLHEHCVPVLGHVLRQGAINKSAYAELCGVGAATASKHLGLLAQRGLLEQTGKGPSTRYLLPAE